jgi:hypothetical protein
MRLIFLIVISVFFLLTFITEIFLKKVGLGDPVRYDSNILYGYSPKPNQKKKRIKGSFVTINKVGLRSLHSWDNDKKKIIFLGDSVTYGGSYIDDNDIFSHQVCKNLKSFICGNAGVNAYSVKNIVMRSKYDERIQDGAIYIYLFPPGDFYREYSNAQTAHFYLNNKKFFLPGIFEASSFVFTKHDINKFISKYDDTIQKEKDYFSLIDYSVEILKNEIEDKKDNKKKVYIFLSNEKNDKNYENELNMYVKNKLIKEINNVNLLNDVLNDDIFFYDESVHFNVIGHEIVAKKIHKIIQDDLSN